MTVKPAKPRVPEVAAASYLIFDSIHANTLPMGVLRVLVNLKAVHLRYLDLRDAAPLRGLLPLRNHLSANFNTASPNGSLAIC